MNAVNPINKSALIHLNRSRERLTPQQYKTLKGQILAGEHDGALRGLKKLIERRVKNGK